MRAQEFISEISDQQLQRYLDRAGRQVDARQERMARVRDRLNRGYEIYHAKTPNKRVDRFEARTPQEATRYYDDFITKYESDVDYELRLRRATGIMEVVKMPPTKNSSQGMADWAYKDALDKKATLKGSLKGIPSKVYDMGDHLRVFVLDDQGPVLYLALDKFLDGFKSGAVTFY